MNVSTFDAVLERVHYLSESVGYENAFVRLEARSVLRCVEILKAFLMDAPQLKVKDGSVLKEIEYFARNVYSHLLSRDIRKMWKPEREQFIYELSNIFAPIRNGKFRDKLVTGKELRPARMDYPSTDQLGFVEHLVKNYLEEVVKSKADSLGPLKTDIVELRHKLRLVGSRLMEMPETRKEDPNLKDLIQSTAEMAYEVEYVVDSFLARDTPMWCCLYWFRDILRELAANEIQVELAAKEREVESDTGSIITSVLSKNPKLHIIPIVNNTREIRQKLKDVFYLHHIRMRFSVLARISVSSYKQRKKQVLLDLLRNASCRFNSVGDRVKEASTSDKSEGELEDLVYQLLNSDSYFIILEDVEDIDVLNDISRFLPNKGYLSKILLTTHSQELARQCRDDSQKDTSTSQTNKPPIDYHVVGFKEETKKMLEQLTAEPKQLGIISIFGMAGQGKTTLVQKLYNNLSVVDYFHTRAWCVVSQLYEKRVLLSKFIGQVIQLSDHQIDDKTNEELAHMLWKSLSGQRFLIILDDMWSIEAWNDLRRCFPNDNIGSRIIITTRLQQLAAQAQPGSILQPLDPLSDDESWELLRKKVFHKESCPPELLGVGIHIAKSCKGLPLAIVLIAGVLAKMERKKDQWKQIAETLNSRVLGVEAKGKGIIELSYKHLPNHLKPCFLYFGAFLKDKEVPVWKLIQLWIVEGFVKHPNLRILEDVAKNYLVDLIGRSLVTIAQEKSNGGVKSCRVHDLLREFKQKKRNFGSSSMGIMYTFLPLVIIQNTVWLLIILILQHL